MLRVFRHYLPLRKALLVLSETVLLTLVLAVGMTLHLADREPPVLRHLAQLGLSAETAQLRCALSAFLVAVLSQVAIAFNELYDFRLSNSRYDRSARFVTSAGSAIAAALGALLLARVWQLEGVLDFPGLSFSGQVQTLVFTLLVGFAILWFWRHVFHWALHRWNFDERVLIVGDGPQAQALAHEIEARRESGFEAVGMLPGSTSARDARPAAPLPGGAAGGASSGSPRELGDAVRYASATSATAVARPAARLAQRRRAQRAEANGNGNGNGSALLGAREPLYELVEKLGVDLVVVALEDRRGSLPTEQLLKCRLAGVPVLEYEAIYEHITGKIAVEALRPSYLIFNEGFGRSPWTDLAKRAMDLVLSTVGLVVTLPVMLVTAVFVRLDSEGSVLFRQERVGRDGTPFTLLKFRSMRADAETVSGPVWASQDDPRITRVGGFLRRTRLDELPQLLNVLLGHMSLVGPRPERPVFVEDLAEQIPYYHQRHIVKPGLTGWAQINYPYGNTVEDALQKLQYDLFYIKNHSLLFDLSILFNTIKIVMLRKGT